MEGCWSPLIAEPLLHKQTHPAWRVGVLAHRIHSQAEIAAVFPPAASLAPPGTVKASHQGGSFQFRPRLFSSCPTVRARTRSNVSHKVASSGSGIQPAAVAVAFMVCGASGASLADNTVENSSPLALVFLSNNLIASESVLPYHCRVPFRFKLVSCCLITHFFSFN